jgi:hypothetical protein
MEAPLSIKPGTWNRKPAGICRVVGCDAKALYRNPGTTNDVNGYCETHRSFAIPLVDKRIEQTALWLTRGEGVE